MKVHSNKVHSNRINDGWIDFEGWCRLTYPPEGVLPDDCWLANMYRRFGVPEVQLRLDWEKAFVAMSPGSDVLRRLACELAAIETSGGNVEMAHFDPDVLGALTDDELDRLDALIEEEHR